MTEERPRRAKPLLPRGAAGTVFKLFLTSVAVGLVLNILGLDPRGLPRMMIDAAGSAMDWLASLFEWGLSYALIGAVVVVPLWLVAKAWGRIRNRR